MNTIFRKVSPEERLPTQTGRYHTNRGLTNYFHEELEYPPKGFEYSIDYWLEEIKLPTDEEIKLKYPTIYGMQFDVTAEDKREVAKWMRNLVLAVTPINIKTNDC